MVAFPDTILHATTFVNTLKEMNKAKMYKKMTIYVEACESGSMFKGLLPEDIDIFATTASNSTTSSYACYFDDVLKTFLGDVYSIKWMEGKFFKNNVRLVFQIKRSLLQTLIRKIWTKKR